MPIVFNPWFAHADIGRAHKVISAGFCSFYVDKDRTVWETWGESVSMNIKSRREDATIIGKYLQYDC